ncbi:unnamed protein product [Heligmosomoides polygyrus]|uniref:phosphoethanolamine N-methyltransferase n=1 Tax=Heligmosomoides polygyrus TaxID=6339 RepID=A0A183GLH1_HELPZ|nr:unnamed protein product [Heligmosomoides polygyrus]
MNGGTFTRSHCVGHIRLRRHMPSFILYCRSKTVTMHSNVDTNPTHYRFSSLYIKLLRAIRYRDSDGKVWKFEVLWSCSVPTYIKRLNNWRQVHWLTRKVLAEGDEETSVNDLLNLFSKTWHSEQKAWDAKLDTEKYNWTDKIFSNAIDADVVPKNSTAFVFTPRQRSPYLHVNSHLLAEKFTCNVWNVETKEYYYRTSLTKANNLKDQRVRFGWNESLTSSIDYWSQRDASFDCLIATELLATNYDETDYILFQILINIFKSYIKGRFYFYSCFVSLNLQRMTECGFKNVSVVDVTEESRTAQATYFNEHSLVSCNRSIFLFHFEWSTLNKKSINWKLLLSLRSSDCF